MRIVLGLAVLSACGPFVPVVEPTVLATAPRVPIIDRAWLDEFVFRDVGPVESWSCRNLLWEDSASVEDAIAQLGYRAIHERKGNAVSDVQCSSQGVSFSTNCWNSVHCTGRALDVRLAGY